MAGPAPSPYNPRTAFHTRFHDAPNPNASRSRRPPGPRRPGPCPARRLHGHDLRAAAGVADGVRPELRPPRPVAGTLRRHHGRAAGGGGAPGPAFRRSPGLLALGTLLAAAGYGLAGFSTGLLGLCLALAIAGAGSSTQHPIASATVARRYGAQAPGATGHLQFQRRPGQSGPACRPGPAPHPAALAPVPLALRPASAWWWPWSSASAWPPHRRPRLPPRPLPLRSVGGAAAFPLLLAIGILDSATRMGPADLPALPPQGQGGPPCPWSGWAWPWSSSGEPPASSPAAGWAGASGCWPRC